MTRTALHPFPQAAPRRSRKPWAAAVLLAIGTLVGCTSLAPPLTLPTGGLPATYDPAHLAASPAGVAQAAHLGWAQYFQDERLRQLIGLALQHNHDVRAAALRVQEAQAAYGVQRSASLLTLGLAADASRSRTPADLTLTGRPVSANTFQAGLGLSGWELDLWGRIASLNEQALQSFLATDAARQAAHLSVVRQVALAYVALRETEARLHLARLNEQSQNESLRIFSRRHELGAASQLELAQVQTLQTQAESLRVQLQQQRDVQRHALELLVGQPLTAPLLPEADSASQTVEGWALPLAAGLPSELLQQRPDIMAAEHQLRAANAQIGAARAAFFPRISLTAFAGTASRELDGLFRGAGRAWSFAPSLSLPIFDAGRNQANLDLAQVRQHLAVVQYEQAIQSAFRDVADALAAQHWLAQQVAVQARAREVQARRARLSRLSYDNGAASFLEVLDAERSLISAEQQLAQTRHALLAAQVNVYAALGGGAAQVPPAPLLPAPAMPARSPAPAPDSVE